MRSRILSFAVIGALTIAVGTATAAPVKLSKAQMVRVVAGFNDKFCFNCTPTDPPHQTNGQGNGLETTNPAGHVMKNK